MAAIIQDGVSIHYSTHGEWHEHMAVVLLSGGGTDSTLWEAQIAHLAAKYFVIAVDHRGVGKSGQPKGPCRADQLAEDVKAILDAERIEKACLVGFSLGGLVAQKFVNNYPGRVDRLVLLNCSLGAGNPDTVLPKREVVNMFLYAAALTQEDICKNAVDYHFGPSLEVDSPAQYRELFEYVMKNSLAIPNHLPILVSDEAFIEDFGQVHIPVMVILSKDDPVTPPENGAAFKKHLPHARIEYLDGYHASMVIHPRAVNALLADFMA